MKWLTISINPPELDAVIVLRTADDFGLGRTFEVVDFDSKVIEKENYLSYLECSDFIEWMELPE